MSLFTILAVYLIIWWLVLFMVLPWGVRGQAEDENITEGTEPGAPLAPLMWRKVAITSVISAVITALVLTALSQGWLDWHNFPFLPDTPEGYEGKI